jgi:hypothetical protein
VRRWRHFVHPHLYDNPEQVPEQISLVSQRPGALREAIVIPAKRLAGSVSPCKNKWVSVNAPVNHVPSIRTGHPLGPERRRC